ncbi:DnaJ subfamily C member 11 [Fasciola hepatica]|uniref:DnaJ subfamily C member 11 n=1 Tax=Fasciola hepatica TaxID=6192 RepID=A0A2H1CFQ8_FASHE|nr:DnaJ subfamily C member 11 [Fasciola hepatica]
MPNEGNVGNRHSTSSQFTKHTDNLEMDRDEDEDGEDLFDDADDPVDPSFLHMLEVDGSEMNGPDLYAVLGVEKTATTAELRVAYRRLSLLLHPDRHSKANLPSDSNQIDTRQQPLSGDAESAFNRVSTAYAILNDPRKRRIYDAYGHEGLKIQGWELANCEKSAPELRLEYLMLRQKALSERQLQLTQPASEFSLGLDFTDLFDRYLMESPTERAIVPMPSIYQLYLAQSITAGLTLRNAVSLAGQVTAHNGLGLGTWMMIWRHYCGKKSLLSYTTIDSEISYGRGGRGLGVGVRFRRSFWDRYVGFFGLNVSSLLSKSQGLQLVLAPGLSTGVNVQLMPRANARLEWRWGLDPGLASEVIWSSSDDKLLARLSASLGANGRAGIGIRLERVVSWSWLNPPRGSGAAEGEDEFRDKSRPDWARADDEDPEWAGPRKDGQVFGSFDVNTLDLVEVTVGAQCSISLHSRLSGSLSFSLQRGVNVKLSLLRGNQTYSLPLRLSEQPSKVALGYGFFVPVLMFAAVRSLIYEPYLKRQLKRAQLSRRLRLRGELARQRREAMTTQTLMRQAADRSREAEEAIGGLVIVRAVYGCVSSTDLDDWSLSDAGGPLNVDVTVPLQALVQNSHLRLPPGHWADVQGFYDPCLGLIKTALTEGVLRELRVLYDFHGVAHEVITSEKQGLAIPMAKHRIEHAQ